MHVVPFVAKQDVTVIAVGDAIEASAVRVLLEGFNYRVTVHWVGSRAELVKLLAGEIAVTGDLVVLSCHGDKTGIVIDDEPPIEPDELRTYRGLAGKTVISTGCLTGIEPMADAFRQTGVRQYVGPVDYPDGSAALVFVGNLFYLLGTGAAFPEAARRAAAFDPGCAQFRFG